MTTERVIWFRRESPRVVRDNDSPLPSCFMDTDVGLERPASRATRPAAAATPTPTSWCGPSSSVSIRTSRSTRVVPRTPSGGLARTSVHACGRSDLPKISDDASALQSRIRRSDVRPGLAGLRVAGGSGLSTGRQPASRQQLIPGPSHPADARGRAGCPRAHRICGPERSDR